MVVVGRVGSVVEVVVGELVDDDSVVVEESAAVSPPAEQPVNANATTNSADSAGRCRVDETNMGRSVVIEVVK